MACFFHCWFRRTAALLIALLFLSGCANPTPAPTASAPHAALTALQGPGKLIRADLTQVDLQKDLSTDVQVEDRIQFEKTGQGFLLFPGRLEVEMYRATDLLVERAVQELSGATTIDLYLFSGNSHLRLLRGSQVQLVFKTDYAVVTTLEPGTEFVVCHTPERITCGVVYEGSVEFRAQGESKIAGKGDGIYVRPGEAPSIAICARMQEVRQWQDDIRGSGEFTPLGGIVSSWPQQPCSLAGLETPTPPAPSLPSREGMVRVEAGLYQIGRADGNEFHIPPQEIDLQAFWIDIFEVSNSRYQLFLQDTGRQPPAVTPAGPDHPVQGVTWEQASAYCAWANKRLPSEAEWEVAARGPGSQPPLYPWGDDRTQGDSLPREEAYPVGVYTFNISPFGVYDMAGNVWEWVGEPYAPIAEGDLILRGGRYGLIRDSAYRQAAAPNPQLFIPHAGFRCAADRVEGE
jgi:formylglycine-generating enzyme required for sulfatase activity